MARKRCLQLNPFEHETLCGLYLARQIASDRYLHRPDDLRALTEAFCALTDRSDRPEEILHYLVSKRKQGKLPRHDGNHLRLPVVLGRSVDDEHVPVLIELYHEFGKGAETYGYDRALALQLERRFFERTGVRKRGILLATALMELRKDGQLPPLGPRPDHGGFTDFEQAEDAG
jgi:hypothetical protein